VRSSLLAARSRGDWADGSVGKKEGRGHHHLTRRVNPTTESQAFDNFPALALFSQDGFSRTSLRMSTKKQALPASEQRSEDGEIFEGKWLLSLVERRIHQFALLPAVCVFRPESCPAASSPHAKQRHQDEADRTHSRSLRQNRL